MKNGDKMQKLKSHHTSNKELQCLLVMPRIVQRVDDGYSFPLGIAYISASLKNAGYKVATINLNHVEGDICNIIQNEINKHDFDLIATGGLSFQFSTIKNIVEAAKQAKDQIITIVGGGIITSDPEAAMNALEFVDYGVIGEGEITICELLNALNHGSNVSIVDGIIYKNENDLIVTKTRNGISNIDSLPWPDYEGFELGKYLEASPAISGMNRKNTIFMIASRSCPYSCTFCFHTTGKKYRQRSLDEFFKELDFMISRYHIEYICLADELFARDLARVKEFCDRLRKYNIRWWAQFRVDDITPELLETLKGGGCDIMSFGLESADNRILKSMRKGTTVEQIERSLKLVYDAGISMEGAFIFGDIEETWETANNTVNWWRDHSEYKINLNLITVFPGSHLYKYACDNGIIKNRVQFLRDGCPQVNVSKLSDEEFSELIKTIMEAPMSLAKVFSMLEMGSLDIKTGRVDIAGTCTVCGHRNRWDGVKMFSASFLACTGCGQRYNVVLPDELRKNIDDNIIKLQVKYGKVAIWGINYHASDLFKYSEVLSDTNIIPVDISETKRKMDLYGKCIQSPDVITGMDISVVVIAIPNYFMEIAGQIQSAFPHVKKIIDVCSLVDPRFID
jgi:anaerobic magnesium-protoporphyrin IX monomethyl ester cyclase